MSVESVGSSVVHVAVGWVVGWVGATDARRFVAVDWKDVRGRRPDFHQFQRPAKNRDAVHCLHDPTFFLQSVRRQYYLGGGGHVF